MCRPGQRRVVVGRCAVLLRKLLRRLLRWLRLRLRKRLRLLFRVLRLWLSPPGLSPRLRLRLRLVFLLRHVLDSGFL